MKWGGRKPSSSSSSRPSFISHVSPFSWLSKFKQMRINSEPKPGTLKQNAKQNSAPSDSSSHYACGNNRGRFYGGDDEAFWRLSFGEEANDHDKKSEDVSKHVKYNLDAEHGTPSSSFGGANAKRKGGKEGTQKLKQKEAGLREERKLLDEAAKNVKELESLRRRYERKAQRVLQEQLLKLERAEEEAELAASSPLENDVMQFESPRTICTPRKQLFSVDSKSYGLGSLREVRVRSPLLGSEWQNLKQTEEMKLKAKSNKQRPSLHVSRENQRRKPKQNSKVKVYSPRMGSKVEVRKIKAIEEKKKAKLKMKKEEQVVEETTGLDSFAVVKCSSDPQRDFRDSMIEMITEKQISQPDEMEDLLACYLTLNSSEYHDLIIQVFKQVWLCMSQASFGFQSEKQCCCCD